MTKTLIVVDNDDVLSGHESLQVISFERYLQEYPKRNEPKTRIINLCDTSQYLSRGYYCSLLAEARQHKVLPSVRVINDLRELDGDNQPGRTLNLGSVELPATKTLPQTLMVYFGWVADDACKKIARMAFEQYPAPVLQLSLLQQPHGISVQVQRFAFSQLNPEEQQQCLERLQGFQRWRLQSAQRKTRWDMAILTDPEEKQPPSDKEAIKRFIKAAAKVGIDAETITSAQTSQIAEYDALFIRETTAIDHHTYRMAVKAQKEGLVVIDDPTSILRCCNKVFLHDAFSYNKVPSLKTRVVIGAADDDMDKIEQEFSYPIVLKMPEGSFSKGVFKVENRDELKAKLDALFAQSALVLVQEFLYTEFDWRIGVLNGRAIYACRYHMARKHWQIYNHDAKRFSSGGFETLPTFEVPKVVLDAALKACAMIGDGLYGVDLKQKDQQVYVIEVNDNPSIEHKVEDAYLGNELYMLIMQEFSNRLEQRGR